MGKTTKSDKDSDTKTDSKSKKETAKGKEKSEVVPTHSESALGGKLNQAG